MSVIVGFHPVREALRHRPSEAVELLVAAGRGGVRRQEMSELCAAAGIPVRVVAPAELERLGGTVDNGFALRLRGAGSERGAKRGDADLCLLLEDVQDPRNLGAVLRVAEGAGVGRVLIRDRGSAPLGAVAVKAAAGASEWLAIERVANSSRAIEALQAEGFWVYGLAAGGLPPWEIDLAGKVALCLGGEGSGLRELTRRHCDGLIGLPMRGRVESLNLATAAAAVLYEAVRQRLGGGSSPSRGLARRGERR